MNTQLLKAIKTLKNGGIVIFPTDTAIGIGCKIDKPESLKRLFEIRRRPKNKPLLVLVDSIKMAQDYLLPIPKKVTDKLIKKYWPGPLTIILKCKIDKVPSLVRSGNTLGVRFPDNVQLLELINGVGFPIVAPSANFAGLKTPFKFEALDPKLVKLADFVLEGKTSSENYVSTIIDCSKESWKIVRQGAITIQNSEFRIQNAHLFIDTSSNKAIDVRLKITGKEYIEKRKVGSNKTQIVLPMIDSLLKKHKMKLGDIGEIKVNTGPGSFTGIRVGMAIANALSFVLKIPVNGRKVVL